MTSQTGEQLIAMHILSNISWNKGNQTMKFGQIIEENMKNNFLKKNHSQNVVKKHISGSMV